MQAVNTNEDSIKLFFVRLELAEAVFTNELPQFKTNKPLEIENLKPLTEVKQPIVDYKTKKEEKVSIIVDSEDPAIKAINDKIVETLKKAGVYDEIYKLSKAIQKLSTRLSYKAL